MLLRLASFVLLITAIASQTKPVYEICDSPIYCNGDLLDTIQMARINVDSKTFVDMKLKVSPAETLAIFNAWRLANPNPNTSVIRQFVSDNFDPEGSEFQPWTPADYKKEPAFLKDITDAHYRQYAKQLNDIWPMLGRDHREDVKLHPELYSAIHVPNPVIVPGGRFREFYYWDSYWVVLGLLHSEMHSTVRGMLSNYMSIVERYGFIPNGGRIYYLGRSQPPLLIPMVGEYLKATDDVDFVRSSIDTMEKEYAYWFNEQKLVKVKGFSLSRYTDRAPGPRPESYWEDRDHASRLENNSASAEAEFFSEIRAGAESGMDFSSRWFLKDGTNNGKLVDIKCTNMVPVELNAILYWNARLLASFHERLGTNHILRAAEWNRRADKMLKAIHEVFWHDDVGAWLDWDLLNAVRRDFYTPTNLSPLWVGAFDRSAAASISEKVMGYVERNGLDEFAGGVPNSLMETGEQWDFPNVWAPMQHLLIVGLSHLGTPAAEEMALRWASRFVYSTYVAFNGTQAMYEKYSAVTIGLGGDGGEYEVQLGFGWSNGAVMDLLWKYGDKLTSSSSASSISASVIAIVCFGLLSRWVQ